MEHFMDRDLFYDQLYFQTSYSDVREGRHEESVDGSSLLLAVKKANNGSQQH